jgi:glycosyltransferase involved in cell wall biosynthesis
LANGEFVAFCDADDYYLDRFVEEAVYLIQEYDLDIVSGGIILQYPELKKSMSVNTKDLLMIDGDTIRRHLLFQKTLNLLIKQFLISHRSLLLFS